MPLKPHSEEQATLKQVIEDALAQAAPIGVQGTGLNTNPERYRQDNHWEAD